MKKKDYFNNCEGSAMNKTFPPVQEHSTKHAHLFMSFLQDILTCS